MPRKSMLALALAALLALPSVAAATEPPPDDGPVASLVRWDVRRVYSRMTQRVYHQSLWIVACADRPGPRYICRLHVGQKRRYVLCRFRPIRLALRRERAWEDYSARVAMPLWEGRVVCRPRGR